MIKHLQSGFILEIQAFLLIGGEEVNFITDFFYGGENFDILWARLIVKSWG